MFHHPIQTISQIKALLGSFPTSIQPKAPKYLNQSRYQKVTEMKAELQKPSEQHHQLKNQQNREMDSQNEEKLTKHFQQDPRGQMEKVSHRSSSKRTSFIKQAKQCLYPPVLLLLLYFATEMLMLAFLELTLDLWAAFQTFFLKVKHVFQDNSMFLLFWSVIIIKTKIPQFQRLYYHTIIRTILSNQETQCSICLNEDCDYLVPKCQHTYHAVCLEKWLKNHPYCPYCRVKVENKLTRKVPWRSLFLSIWANKIRWILIVSVCFFLQYRFSNHFLTFTLKQ